MEKFAAVKAHPVTLRENPEKAESEPGDYLITFPNEVYHEVTWFEKNRDQAPVYDYLAEQLGSGVPDARAAAAAVLAQLKKSKALPRLKELAATEKKGSYVWRVAMAAIGRLDTKATEQ